MAALAHYPDLDLCISELYFENGDGLALLSAVRSRFRRARVIIVSSYNLQNFSDYTQGLTIFPTPLDESVFMSTCQDTLVTLEGHEFPPFRLGKKQPPDRWGDCYAAYDTGVKRDIFITVCHSWATPEDAERFRKTSAMMARAVHPNVQAVYQAGVLSGPRFLLPRKMGHAEPVGNGHGRDSTSIRASPRRSSISSAPWCIFWDANQYPHTTVGATDVTVSPQGVIKVANCVDPTQERDAARHVRSLRAGPRREGDPAAAAEEVPRARAQSLGSARRGPGTAGPDRQRGPGHRQQSRAGARDRRHARSTRSRRRRSRSSAANRSAVQYIGRGGLRAHRRWWLAACSIRGSIRPRTSSTKWSPIPAGPYMYQDGPATMDHTFYIDKYEVTFGQYLKFLRAVAKAGNDAAWRDPSQPPTKSPTTSRRTGPITRTPMASLWRAFSTASSTTSPTTRLTSRSTTPSSTSIGTTRRPTPNGPANACPTSRNGRRPRAARTASSIPGATLSSRSANNSVPAPGQDRIERPRPCLPDGGPDARATRAPTASTAWPATSANGPLRSSPSSRIGIGQSRRDSRRQFQDQLRGACRADLSQHQRTAADRAISGSASAAPATRRPRRSRVVAASVTRLQDDICLPCHPSGPTKSPRRRLASARGTRYGQQALAMPRKSSDSDSPDAPPKVKVTRESLGQMFSLYTYLRPYRGRLVRRPCSCSSARPARAVLSAPRQPS